MAASRWRRVVYVSVNTMTRTRRTIAYRASRAWRCLRRRDTCFTSHETATRLVADAGTEPYEPGGEPQGGLWTTIAHAQTPQVGLGRPQPAWRLSARASAAVTSITSRDENVTSDCQPDASTATVSESSACARTARDETAAGAVQLERETGACVICHPTISRVSYTAQPTRAQLG